MARRPTDFAHIVATLRRHRVRFIVVGGVAAVVEGAPVATFDLDIVPDCCPRIVVRLLIAEAELDAAMAAVRRHLEDPHTLEIFTLYFQAWGRKA